MLTLSYLQDFGITCCSCGRGIMVFGGKVVAVYTRESSNPVLITDGSGFLHILTSLSSMLSIEAYVLRIQYIYQLKTRNIILTVGDDEDFTPLIRVWNLDKVHITK